MNSAIKLTPCQCQSQAFLILLGSTSKEFNFRTFSDKRESNRSGLVGKFSGKIANCEPALRQLNAKGAGVFVVINDGGHTDGSIARVRAVFADTDGAPLGPIVQALKPHCVISTSPDKWHVYWLVDQEFPLDQFKPVQQAIARKFHSDHSVCNLSRVMRLPGFLHNKKEPYDVHFETLNRTLPRYSLEQIRSGLGLQKQDSADLTSLANDRSASSSILRALHSNSFSLDDVEEMLPFINPWCDRATWMKVMFALAEEYGEGARDLAVRWSRGDLWQGQNT